MIILCLKLIIINIILLINKIKMNYKKNKIGKIILIIFLVISAGLGIAAFVMSFTKKCKDGFQTQNKFISSSSQSTSELTPLMNNVKTSLDNLKKEMNKQGDLEKLKKFLNDIITNTKLAYKNLLNQTKMVTMLDEKLMRTMLIDSIYAVNDFVNFMKLKHQDKINETHRRHISQMILKLMIILKNMHLKDLLEDMINYAPDMYNKIHTNISNIVNYLLETMKNMPDEKIDKMMKELKTIMKN